jgi:iron complex outermembrane receptor protein
MARRLMGASWIAASVAAISGPAHADNAAAVASPAIGPGTPSSTTAPGPADSHAGLEEIVVTAQFRQQSLQSTPLSITAVNSAMLEARGQTSLSQVGAQAPNVTLSANNPVYGSSMAAYIRGVGQNDFNYALEPGVGIYVDDVYLASLTGTMLDLINVDRIEILRGPQGTLAGKNSIGGAVKIVSAKPTNEASSFAEVETGSRNRIDVRARANFPLIDNALYMSVAMVSRNQDGYIKQVDYACSHPGSGLATTVVTPGNCQIGTLGDKSEAAARVAFRFNNGGPIEVNLAADFTRDRSEAGGSVLTGFVHTTGVTYNGVPYDNRFIGPGGYTSYATFTDPRPADAAHPSRPYAFPPINHLTSGGVSNIIDWDLGRDLALKSITAYRSYKNSYAVDGDASPIPVEQEYDVLTQHQFSQELRLNGKFSHLFDYTLGAFYINSRGNYASRTSLAYAGDFDFLTNDPTPASSIAGFTQIIWHLTDRFDVIGGYRFTHDDKSYTFVRKNPDGSNIQPADFVNNIFPQNAFLYGLDGLVGHYEKSRSDYRLDATYQFTSDFMAYAEYSTGYKGGGINPRPYFASQIVSFAPETIQAYEVGFKSDLFGRRVRLNMSAFFNNYNDIQLNTLSCDALSPFPGAPCYATVNAGHAHVKGAELETTLKPIERLTIDASLGYLDFKYVSVDPTTGISLSNVTPYTSRWRASSGVQYDIPLGASGLIIPRLDATYQSVSYADPQNGPATLLQAHTLLNARLMWRNETHGLEAAFEVTNLADKYYYVARGTFVHASVGVPGEPRSFGLSLKKSF